LLVEVTHWQKFSQLPAWLLLRTAVLMESGTGGISSVALNPIKKEVR